MAPTVAFFGATGDCAGHTLANTLKAGYDCVALARTPEKLEKSMQAKGVSAHAIDQHLTIVEGNARDTEAVKKALQVKGQVVDIIVSGIGSNPTLQWSLYRPVVLQDETICEDVTNTILDALSQLKSAKKPLFVNVLTTGIQPKGKPRDVPLAFTLLYHWLLASPHEDKEKVQEKLIETMQLPEAQRAIRAFVNVKPSLLVDGEGCGLQTIREGTDETPAVGYTIQRKDVGLWMFERLVKAEVKGEWLNKGVSITY